MAFPNQQKNRSTSTPYKPFEPTNSGMYSCSLNDAGFRQLNTKLGAGSNASIRPGSAASQSSSESNFKTADRVSQVQKVLANSHDYMKLIADSTERTEAMRVLMQKSSTLVTVTQTVKVREVSQLALFIDETTVVIVTQLRTFQQTTVFSNIDEVVKSLSQLSGLLDSRLKRLEALFAECLAAVGRVSGALTGSSKVRAIQTAIASLISKVPRIQAFLVKGIAVVGKSLAALGVAIGAYQAYDKWHEWSENKSPENLKKAIIETIAFIVGLVLIVVAAVIGGVGAIIIGAILLIYGIVDAYFSFKDPDHQDFIAQAIYAGGEALYAQADTLVELSSRIEESISRAIQQTRQYLHDLYVKVTHVITELTDKVEKQATELFDNMLLNFRDSLSHLPQF